MNRIEVSANFYLDEFIDPHTYFNRGDHGLSLVDPRLFDQAQLLRYLYGKSISINNWWGYYSKNVEVWGKDHTIKRIEQNRSLSKWSGVRTNRCPIGSKLSAHRIEINGKGMAIDPKGNEIEFYKIVKSHAQEFYDLGLRRLEDIRITKGWLHMDLLERNTKPNSIRVVGLKTVKNTIYF